MVVRTHFCEVDDFPTRQFSIRYGVRQGILHSLLLYTLTVVANSPRQYSPKCHPVSFHIVTVYPGWIPPVPGTGVFHHTRPKVSGSVEKTLNRYMLWICWVSIVSAITYLLGT